ncbi:SlyX family protein [Kangiella sp. TOML190]|uniref:SlyX family protein n=1 Tax=Kangiella sp. TOML190 TaxID=2931351 RepID=UPI00203F698A|nr:SlyX family protein [Kangiella sp. TOML190]
MNVLTSELTQLQLQIESLETKIAFQDDAIEQLNQVITKQDAIIRKMEEKFLAIGEKLQDMQSQMPDKPFNPADELPPHY